MPQPERSPIFTVEDMVDMAVATHELSQLVYTTSKLNNTVIIIRSIDDPYYMRLSAETYRKVALN
jgi:hypothetical protein